MSWNSPDVAIAEMLVLRARECREHGLPMPDYLAEELRKIVERPDVFPEEMRSEVRRLLEVGQA
jgi:hypothetical protein